MIKRRKSESANTIDDIVSVVYVKNIQFIQARIVKASNSRRVKLMKRGCFINSSQIKY